MAEGQCGRQRDRDFVPRRCGAEIAMALVGAAGSGVVRALDWLHEPGESAAGAGNVAEEGTGGADGDRRGPRAVGQAVDDGESGAIAGGWRGGNSGSESLLAASG